jgi:hypothetical protein
MAQQGYPNGQPLQVPANVYELMVSHQLGRLVSFYPVTRAANACAGVLLIVVGVFCELSLLPLLLLLGVLLSVSHTQISVANLLTPWGVGVALFFLLCVLFGVLIVWQGFRLFREETLQRWYLCEEGLISLTRRRETVMRWDQVTSVTRYRLRRSDGAELAIGGDASLGGSIGYHVAHKQLPQVLASYHAGVPISFGGLTVTQQGLSLHQGRKTLPWSEVSAIEFSSDYVLSICKQGKVWNRYSNARMPNAWTFLELMSALGIK